MPHTKMLNPKPFINFLNEIFTMQIDNYFGANVETFSVNFHL